MQIYKNWSFIASFFIFLSIVLCLALILNTEVTALQLNQENLFQIINQPDELDNFYNVRVGDGPTFIETNRDSGDKLYVANRDSGTISVISLENYTKIGEDIPVGDWPSFIKSNYHDELYVANSDSGTISVISTENDTKIGEDIPVGKEPRFIETNRNGDKLYVANYGSNTISVISLENYTKIGEDIPVGKHPIFIASNYNDELYVANALSNTVSVISTKNNSNIGAIPVGADPIFIESGTDNEELYVANYISNTVSVISTENYTKIGEDIPVGDGPISIVKPLRDYLYVANRDSGTISVISLENYTKIGEDIPVGDMPSYIDINFNDFKLYVANFGSNTISVINILNNSKIGEDIPVGDMPINVFFERYRDALFVANFASDGISVIDGVSDKVVGRVSFDVNPPRSGNIKCDNITAPLERNFYLDSGISCKAIPNKGFEFLSWEENLSKNSTQLINASKPATPLESILDFFNLRPEEPEATLKVSAFGSFTANFRELPPPLPPAYWATLFGFVLTTGLGAWLIPSLLRWTRSKAEIKKSNYYHQTIKSLYADRKLDEKNIKDLDDLERDITDIYLKGKINEIHYSNLKKEISIMYDKIFRKNIDSLKDSSDKTNLKEQLNKLKNYIEITQSEQKITEPQFNLLNKKISEIWDEANYEAEK